MPKPQPTELLRDIHETNLMYLLLLQRLAREGNAGAAGARASDQACRWLAGQSRQELVKLAQSSVLLARLDLPPRLLLSALSQGLDATLAGSAAVPASHEAPAGLPRLGS
ncbi:transcriptional regulator [Achromobacter sp. RTa]|uniref:flagellar transcriptional regulator FlhD n=1 Tax=Achromobacter sp. RTa TaxID=1532557 RepID=UPI00050F2ECA|nr:flagellar transcriptional regulator FlhD [Achromobacter sp. RTa]KGD86923.1 transcriptional regulator [Achromobacter sp. RTa]